MLISLSHFRIGLQRVLKTERLNKSCEEKLEIVKRFSHENEKKPLKPTVIVGFCKQLKVGYNVFSYNNEESMN